MKRLIILILCLFIGGCSTAGPFVTSISSDGKGNLIIEKQKVLYNWLFGVISTEELTTSNIRIITEEKER